MITVPIDLADRSYEVIVGDGAIDSLSSAIAPTVRQATVVTQRNIAVEVDPGVDFEVVYVEDGESAKSLANVEMLCRSFSMSGLARTDIVIAVGGGVVTDLAGYAASSFHRGISYINVATSLLGQVDAAIGGKTGVNLPEGKNLVGSFWQPKAVICDTGTLATLPPREWASGRGEMAKYAFLGKLIGNEGSVEEFCDEMLDMSLEEQVALCVEIKGAAVTTDEREGAQRMLLNYGHTLAHALEGSAMQSAVGQTAGGHAGSDIRHGEAVAIGLVFAAELASRMGRIDQSRVEVHRRVVKAFELSSDIPAGSDADELVEFMMRDKKSQHDLTFVLDGPGGVEPVRNVSRKLVTDTLVDLGATS